MPPEAKCPKCGARYFGWALRDPKYQKCEKCGAQLEVIEQGMGKVVKSPVHPEKNT